MFSNINHFSSKSIKVRRLFDDEPIPKAILFLIITKFQIVFMIMNLIDYSKYKAQEINFEFWNELYTKLIRQNNFSFVLLPIDKVNFSENFKIVFKHKNFLDLFFLSACKVGQII